MVKSEGMVGKRPTREDFMEMLARIKNRYQRLGSLKIWYDDGLDYFDMPIAIGSYSLVETKWELRWGIIPQRKSKKLFGIGDPRMYDKIPYAVFDETIMSIVQEELNKFCGITFERLAVN